MWKCIFRKLTPVLIGLLYICLSGCNDNTVQSEQFVHTDIETKNETEMDNQFFPATPRLNCALSIIDGSILEEYSSVIRTKTSFRIDQFDFIAIEEDSHFRIFVYDFSNPDSAQYLGCTEWKCTSVSSDDIKMAYSKVTDIRIELKCDDDGENQTMDSVKKSGIVVLSNGEIYSYDIGTIFAYNGIADFERNTRFFTNEYLMLDDYKCVALEGSEYYFTWFAYSTNGSGYDYLGTSDWQQSGFFSRRAVGHGK